MNAQIKKVMLILAVTLAIPAIFGACTKKANYKSCKKDSDCQVDASGNPQQGVCYMGKCEECVENTDCSGTKQCVNNRCESSCQVDADCGANKHCDNNICMPDCMSNSSCTGGDVCSRGRCMSQLEMERGGSCDSLEYVHFDYDRYDIKASDRPYVERLAQCLESNPESTVLLEGHTDNRGTPAYNDVLGHHRAVSVKEYLEKQKGISSNRIETVSYGETRPVSEAQTEEAFSQNRRTEFKLRGMTQNN